MSSKTQVRHRTPRVHPQLQTAPNERLLRDQARAWTSFAARHSTMRRTTIERKAEDSLAFCRTNRTRGFAVPSKLSGTSRHQESLVLLHELRLMRGHRLGTHVDGERIVVSFTDMVLGEVQAKHTPWLRPLLEHGASVHLLAVTGTERAEGFWGLNVAFAHLAPALTHLQPQEAQPQRAARTAPGAREAAQAPPDENSLPDEDILLWREPCGTARASIAHVPRHSSAIEWGYSGSGPADLARSILLRFVGLREADRLYQAFKRQVIASLPPEGGLIEAAFVRSWLAAHRAVRT